VEKFKKISFIEAAILVGEQCGVNVESLLKKANATALNPKVKRLLNANALASEFYEGFLYNPENAHYLDYLHNRGLDDNTIKYFNIGYAQNKYDMIFNILTNKDEMLGKKDENSV
jgi:DNA primase